MGNYSSEAVVFSHMRGEIDEYLKNYGDGDTPPPWQTFTIANDIKDGNNHLVQKVFEGAFEVIGSLQ